MLLWAVWDDWIEGDLWEASEDCWGSGLWDFWGGEGEVCWVFFGVFGILFYDVSGCGGFKG